jgi:hypothetical protein
MLLPITFFLLGSPAAIYWFVRIITRWNVPWFEGREITRIEFPLPPLVPNALELIPVAMMVGSNTEAKRCAYCHEEFDAGSARRFCSSCGSATHQECATLNEGCNVYGCSGTFCQ